MDLGEFLGGIHDGRPAARPLLHGVLRPGFAQGTIRRLIGIASVLFSFLLAANLSEPLGNFLGNNWTQFSRQYSLHGRLRHVFVAAAVAFALVAQGFYKPQPLFEKARFVDELLGGLPRAPPGGADPRRA